MGVKGGDLVNLGHGQAHLRGQGLKMPGREMAETVLNEMQILDQEVAAKLARPQDVSDLLHR